MAVAREGKEESRLLHKEPRAIFLALQSQVLCVSLSKLCNLLCLGLLI